MNLFLDIETTGLPEKGSNWREDYMTFPYVVEIAWVVRNKQKRFLIHQEGRKMPKGAQDTHGITTKMSNDIELTQPASFVFGMLLTDAYDAVNIIGHNLYFDTSIIKANILRLYGEDSKEAEVAETVFHKDRRIDTMRASQRLFGKWPRLSQLHEYLFEEEMVGAHGALADTLATQKCYNELVKRKLI